MTQVEFTTLLKEQIEKSSHPELVDFSVAICEQLFPEYISFATAEDFGNIKLMRQAIDFCKLNKDRAPEDIAMDIDLDELEEHIPDVDESETLDSSNAMNASCAIFELLEYLSDNDTDHVINITTYMTDTLQFKLSESDPTLVGADLDHHPAMVDERIRILAIL